MSNSISHAEDGAHSGPVKNPRQFITTVLAAFVLPIFIIIGLVLYVTHGPKPAGTNSAEAMNMGGVTEMSRERALAQRLQKVGTVEIRDANRPLRTGEEVFKAQCSACHATGVAGAPKFGDKGAWAPRIAHGYEALLTSALKGKGAMSPQGGGDFNDTEIGRAVVYMANAGGANFPDPKGGAPDGAAPAAAPMAQAATPATPASAVLSAGTPAAQASTAAALGNEAKASAAAAASPAAAASATPAATTLAATTPGAATTPAAPTSAAAPAAAKAVAAVAPAPAAPAVDLAAGEALYKSACFACHAAGVAGAPKFGNKADWAPRIATGMDTLVNAVKHGLGAMPPRGGTSASDEQIASAVAYMVNAAK